MSEYKENIKSLSNTIETIKLDNVQVQTNIYRGRKFGTKIAIMAAKKSKYFNYDVKLVNAINIVCNNSKNATYNTQREASARIAAEMRLTECAYTIHGIDKIKKEDIPYLHQGFDFIINNHYPITQIIPDYVEMLKYYYGKLNGWLFNSNKLFDLNRFK